MTTDHPDHQPPNDHHAAAGHVPIRLDDVAEAADVARRMLDLAARTGRHKTLEPGDDRYAQIVEAVDEAAEAASHATWLIIEATWRR